jgi:pimeloyl-ACP methyl ester carboxylesterase
MKARRLLALFLLLAVTNLIAAPVKQDEYIDALDPGIKLFVRSKQPERTVRATDDNVVLCVHGATYPSTPDFDLQYKDYSWADWMVDKGYIVYMFDKRNYGFSTREKAMDQPAASNKPVTRSFLAIRDIGAVVDHIRKRHGINKVTLIGWSWGATTAGYYTSLNSEKVKKLVMYAPAYAYAQHTNLGAGSGSQDKRKPNEFNYALGAYRLGSKAANDGRWDGEIPVADKNTYREEGVRDAFALEALKTDPTSESRSPASLRAPNGVLEDSFMQATGRRIWNASSIYVPTLVIAGEFDTWSFPEDRELLMRDLTNAPVKKLVMVKNATHFVLFEKPRLQFFGEIHDFISTAQ